MRTAVSSRWPRSAGWGVASRFWGAKGSSIEVLSHEKRSRAESVIYFTDKLPRRGHNGRWQEGGIDELAGERGQTNDGQGKHILLVDDKTCSLDNDHKMTVDTNRETWLVS
jgi:hypothetical protein